MRAALITASVLILAACNMAADAQESGGGGGEMTQRSYNISGFKGVALEGPFDVVVRVGSAHSVRAEGNSRMLDRLRLEVEDGNLTIGTKREGWGNFRYNGPTTRIFVTMPAIEVAAIGGSGDLRIDKVEGRRFDASIGGSGDIQVESLRVNDAHFSVAGSGSIRAAGTAARSDISIAGSGDIDIAGLETRDASISVMGSGDVRARATQTANVSIMGSGNVNVSGSAKCSVSKMGSGNLSCGS
jgi:hypothetical protein